MRKINEYDIISPIMKGFTKGDNMTRRAGVLCPLFSVPGNQGIGDLGEKTNRMIDAIADAGYKIWQILPLQFSGQSHSPYQTYSSFAGDPIYINIDRLSEMGLLNISSITNCNKFKDYVDYDTVRAFKEPYLKKAFRAFKKQFEIFQTEYEEFCKEAFWLDDWATYQVFKNLHDQLPWNEWEEEYRDYPLYQELELDEFKEELFYHKFLQFIFYSQLDDIRIYAHSRGLEIMGDVPFYVDLDSADVWSSRDDFLLDEKGEPKFVAGCPPDYFSETGQRWGMPIYDFTHQKLNDYCFWSKRMAWMSRCFDIVRIDHFRAFDTYWKIPSECPTAIDGEWIEGPSHELIRTILETSPKIQLVAEDLGMIRPEVLDLEADFDIPGMDVLLFRLESKLLKKPTKKEVVVYTGTHDNMTANQMYYTLTSNQRISLRRFFKKQGYEERNFHDMLCHYALDTLADTVILPIWDICGYKEEARINFPGTVSEKNWTWKLKDFKIFPDELKKTSAWIKEAKR